jgi:hypothetical protein
MMSFQQEKSQIENMYTSQVLEMSMQIDNLKENLEDEQSRYYQLNQTLDITNVEL